MRYSNIIPLFIISLSYCFSSAEEPALDNHKISTSKPLQPKTDPYNNLRKFYLGPLTITNLNGQQAIQKLIARYHTICEETGEQPLHFKTEFPKKLDKKMSFVVREGSFNFILNQISAAYKMNLQRDKALHRFTSYKEDIKEDAELFTKTFRVHPDFNDIVDKRIFQDKQISHLSFNPTKSLLVVRGTNSSLDRIQTLVDNLNRLSPKQTKTIIALIQYPANSITPGINKILKSKSLTNETCQTLIKKSSQLKDVKINTMTSIVSRHGEEALLQIIQELPNQDKQTDAPEHKTVVNPKQWAGLKFSINSRFIGYTLQSNLDINFHHAEGIDFNNLNSNNLKLDKKVEIEELRTILQISQKPGETRIIRVKSPDTSIRYIAVTQVIIDATGQPIK